MNKEISEQAYRKGYGSFMLEMARAFAFEMNELGIACRLITVDADIDYEPNTPEFYKKNGFVENLKYKKKKEVHTISMRKIFLLMNSRVCRVEILGMLYFYVICSTSGNVIGLI